MRPFWPRLAQIHQPLQLYPTHHEMANQPRHRVPMFNRSLPGQPQVGWWEKTADPWEEVSFKVGEVKLKMLVDWLPLGMDGERVAWKLPDTIVFGYMRFLGMTIGSASKKIFVNSCTYCNY